MLIKLTCIESILKPLNNINPENLTKALDLFGIWVFCNAYQVLVKDLHGVQVWCNLIFILTDTSSNSNVLEQLKDKLILILVLMYGIPCLGILYVLP